VTPSVPQGRRTSRTDIEPRENVEFVRGDPVLFVERLKQGPEGTILLFDDGPLATSLATAGPIDDSLIVIQPILLGGGVRPWQEGLGPQDLEPVHARECSGRSRDLPAAARAYS
jgi:hypothetical protein